MRRLFGWLGAVALFTMLLATGPAAQAAGNETIDKNWPVSARQAGEKVTPQAVCNIARGGSNGQFICEYGVIDIFFQSRCHTFVIGTDYSVWYAWETTTASNAPCNDTASQGGTWSGFHSLGGQARAPWWVATDGSSWITVAVTGRFNNFSYCNDYSASAGGWSGWSDPGCP